MLDQLYTSLEVILEETQANYQILAIILAIPWGIFLISCIEKNILFLGILPRSLRGLPGILFAPLLHANFNHIFFNSIPLLVLSNFILINNGVHDFILVTCIITIGSGILIWCFGKHGLHIGASALITGYWALLVVNIFRQGTLNAIILGIISLYYFAGIFLGVFPGKKGVSWEGHFFGLLVGLAVGYYL